MFQCSQTRFALSSCAVFSRTDIKTDSERFYNTVLEFLNDVEERLDVDALLMWWNRYELRICYFQFADSSTFYRTIFPGSASACPRIKKGSALARLAERRRRIREEQQRENRERS